MPEKPRAHDLARLTRAIYEAASPGDLDAVTGFCDTDAVWEVAGLGSDFRGAAAIRGFPDDWTGAYEDFRMEPEEVCDLGGGVTFAVIVQSGTPVGSSGRVHLRLTSIAVWADGVVAHTIFNSDIDAWRAAAERPAANTGVEDRRVRPRSA